MATKQRFRNNLNNLISKSQTDKSKNYRIESLIDHMSTEVKYSGDGVDDFCKVMDEYRNWFSKYASISEDLPDIGRLCETEWKGEAAREALYCLRLNKLKKQNLTGNAPEQFATQHTATKAVADEPNLKNRSNVSIDAEEKNDTRDEIRERMRINREKAVKRKMEMEAIRNNTTG